MCWRIRYVKVSFPIIDLNLEMLVHADGNGTTVHYALRLEVCYWHIKYPLSFNFFLLSKG